MQLIPNEILSSENISDKGVGVTGRNFDAIIIGTGQAGSSLAEHLNAAGIQDALIGCHPVQI